MSTAGLAVHGMYYTDWYSSDLTLIRSTAQVDVQFSRYVQPLSTDELNANVIICYREKPCAGPS